MPESSSVRDDLEAKAWRRRAQMSLGDAATDADLRRMLGATIEQLGVDLAKAYRERDELRAQMEEAPAVSRSLAGDLDTATEALANYEHAVDVFAELLAAGDLDGLRMHIEHMRSGPKAGEEVARG